METIFAQWRLAAEGWPSVFFHPKLKLLLVVYVDDFKMSGPKESMQKGWELIGSKIDMDTPTEANRYLGCDHTLQTNVKLKKTDHPFTHLFDKSVPDPAAKLAAPAHRTQDCWETDPKLRVHADVFGYCLMATATALEKRMGGYLGSLGLCFGWHFFPRILACNFWYFSFA